MKKLIFISFIYCLIQLPLFSQQSVNQKKVYKSGEDDRLYINKNQGVYLWISVSPDPSSEKILLESDSTVKYANPMYFDTEGYNTVRSPSAVDTASKQIIYPIRDIIFEVYADGIAPKTEARFNSSVSRNIDGKNYFGNDLKVVLNATDAVSGIALLKYALNDNPMADYKDELSNFNEGENTIKFYAEDHVGNVEDINENVFYIDKTPPKTEYEIDGLQNDNFVSPDAVIKLTASDNLSGIKSTYYQINGGTTHRYTQPIPVKSLTSGEGIITFYSEDNLGNKEKERVIGGKGNEINVEEESSEGLVFEFYVDNDPPEVALEVEGDSYAGKYNYVSSRSKFNITANDDKAGVDQILYSVNSSKVDVEYEEPFSIEEEGLHNVRFKASDFVGNVSYIQTKPYYCDITPPVSNVTVGTPKFSSRDTLFISEKTKLNVVSKDALSGISAILYSLNNGEAMEYSDEIVIDNPGFNKLTYYAKDNLNNIEQKKELEVYVDNTPPMIHYHFSVDNIGSKSVRDESYTIYPTNAMLYIAATDARSGGERLEYTINDGAVKTANPIKGLSPGNYLIKVQAYDVLGNESTESIKFAIEE